MKKVVVLIAFIVGCIIGYWVCDNFNKPTEIVRTVTVFKDVDSTQIIQKAKVGMITISDAKKLFKQTIHDTLLIDYSNAIIGDDSATYNNDSILVEYAKADTTVVLEKNTPTDSIKVILEIDNQYVGKPIGQFITDIVLKEFSHIHSDTLRPVLINNTKDKIKYSLIGAAAGIAIFETLRIVTKLLVVL